MAIQDDVFSCVKLTMPFWRRGSDASPLRVLWPGRLKIVPGAMAAGQRQVYTVNGRLYTKRGWPIWRMHRNTKNVTRNAPKNNNVRLYNYINEHTYNAYKSNKEYYEKKAITNAANKAKVKANEERQRARLAELNAEKKAAREKYLKNKEAINARKAAAGPEPSRNNDPNGYARWHLNVYNPRGWANEKEARHKLSLMGL